jgi:hypothetical protein
MNSQSRRRFIGLWLMLAISASGMMTLWFSRAFYFHATLAGWGDPAADKQQSHLWWARLGSLALLVFSAIISAVCSSRFRWAILGGTIVTAASALAGLSKFAAARSLSFLLLPGWFAEASVFGVHADLSWLTTPLCWMLGINTALYALVVALISQCVIRKTNSSEAKLRASN